MNYMEILNISEDKVQKCVNKLKYGGANSRHELLMDPLRKFYKEPENLNKLLNIVNGCSKISLRLIDWFVTNYSKKHNTVIDSISEDGKPKKKMIHLDYKSQLKAYSKRWFDPFCRRERINFPYSDNQELTTTVGQLNFFRWFIENKYLIYLENNREEIDNDMNTSLRNHYKNSPREKKETSTDTQEMLRRKRHELSVSAVKTVNKHNVKIIVDFS